MVMDLHHFSVVCLKYKFEYFYTYFIADLGRNTANLKIGKLFMNLSVCYIHSIIYFKNKYGLY